MTAAPAPAAAQEAAPAPAAAVPSIPAGEGEPLARCVHAFGEAQRLRREGKLRASRAELLACARSECPSVLVERCVPWLRELDAALPSIVVAARDEAGADTTQVRVIEGGVVLAERLDGRALPLDPGPHELRFEHPGAVPVERRLVLTEAERSRRVEISFAARGRPRARARPEVEPAAGPRAGLLRPAWLAGLGYAELGVGAAALVVGTVTGAVALSEMGSVRDGCPGDICPTELGGRYRRAATLAHVSTIGFIAAGVGTATGAASLFLCRRGGSAGAAERAELALRPALGFGTVGLAVTFW
ncbi:MAG: hypothetical protein HY744_27630 [Deltaproteobacteria bacterium]|nr:hypothetical protein [Deltaproteobacteria bacterium]